MLKELQELEEDCPVFQSPTSPTQRVGAYLADEFESAEHRQPLLSLSNAFEEEELRIFRRDYGGNSAPETSLLILLNPNWMA
ncbi:hypothetical protein KGY79_00565 [Candidatus Bipolaricaulota bacterium]|nr:hypothetical protein [Candidatus Bipolaricaulota bacterium]